MSHAPRGCYNSGRICTRRHLQRCYATTSKKSPSSQRGFPVAIALASGTGFLGYFGWKWQQGSSHSRRPLSYSHFTPLTIRAIKQITSDSSVVSLELPESLLPDEATYPEPPHTPLQAIYIRQPELQIQRAYTPLSLDCFKGEGSDARSIELLVKRYQDGEVSSYVHRQGPGDQLWVRGPVRTWTLPEVDDLIFVSRLSWMSESGVLILPYCI